MRISGNPHFILLTGIANRITAESIPLTLTLCFLSLLFQFTPFLQAENNEVGAVTFNRDIRPILSDNCLACHGPDEKSRKADLRLDTEEGATMDLGGYKAVDPGNVEKSELLKRIFTEDLDDVMPPPESNKSLTEEEKQKIQAWIHQGAVWENHWSFIPVKRPYVFDSSTFHWGINSIDYFIQDRLDQESLPHSPPADRITLLRRATLDLTGLPPSLDDLDIFIADRSPSAYENLVDRLLQSSAYGEHMARYWLDAVRYGDTHGLHLDNYREIWPYRDWVIGAFNDNMPYDQFITEQLAGDLLPNPTDDQMVATGYNRCHVTTNEGGSIREEVYVRNVVDRVVNFGTVFMGMTFECTRCHDHKFDPFTMDDFYSMFAYFNSIDGSPLDGNRKDPAPVIKLPDATQKQELESYDTLIAFLENKLKSPWLEIDHLQEAWEKERTTALSSSSKQPVAKDLTLGDWFTIGPFSDVRRYLNKRKHGPEGKPVNLS
ncbi:MAG TPA: DUF1549 domain-containing protein, partial [Verrucomicrobia bacterium]|nr:DUF1549 domain-containing protein [Verrucomicrobiota bacterium]